MKTTSDTYIINYKQKKDQMCDWSNRKILYLVFS